MKRKYMQPQLTIVSFTVEQGYTATGAQPASVNSFSMEHMFDEAATEQNQASQYEYSDWQW